MIYKLLGCDKSMTSMKIERYDKDSVTITVTNESPLDDDQEKDCYITLSEQDIYDLVGVLTELRKRIVNHKNK